MTAARLRSLLTAGSTLPCSPVKLVGPDGCELWVSRTVATVAAVRTENEVDKPDAVPQLVVHLTTRPDRESPLPEPVWK